MATMLAVRTAFLEREREREREREGSERERKRERERERGRCWSCPLLTTKLHITISND